MANLKSITELPVAESADGLNLIVNDNGAAKQIAASAVGAQADFAVTDETNPAFIKNKPAVAQSDWSIEDSSNPAFIKNKPFYDTREFGTVTLTFDGDLTGKEFVQLDDNFGAIKLFDGVASKEELIGGTFVLTTPGGAQTIEITEDLIAVLNGMIGIGPTQEIIVIPQELITGDISFTSAGVWTMCGLQDGVPVFYVSEISWNSVVSGELRTVDSKYIKDMYYTKVTEDVEILSETTIEISEGSFIELQTPMILDLVSGMDYIVNWNGNSYVCKANFDGEWFCLEAVDVFSIWTYPYIFDNDGYYAEIEIYDGSTSVTLSIIGPSAEVKKIDVKYMPYEVQDSINELYDRTDNAYNMANNKMDKDNPTGTGSFSMNRKANTAIGDCSHAEGFNTTASGQFSHAEGTETTASGYYSHAEGSYTTASSSESHAEGVRTEASGQGAHAEGNGTKALQWGAHAEGFNTTASGQFSHAEGSETNASGKYSHAEGWKTIASNFGGHAEGCETTASGNYSHAEGSYTEACGVNQHVQGKYNIVDTSKVYAHIVGNGTADTARSNAHTLDWSGNAWYQGTVEGTGFILASPNGTRYKITVANDGTLSAVAV